MYKKISISATCLCLVSSAALAQDSAKFSIGAAFISGNNVYSGASAKSRFAPSISYENEIFKIGLQDGFAYKVLNNEGLKLSVAISPSFAPFESADSPALSGMSREMTVDATVSGTFDIVRGTSIKARYSSELTKQHGGSLVDISLSQFLPIAGQPVVFSLGAKRYDGKLSMYRYGVKQSEVTENRAAYAPGVTNIPYLSANTFHELSQSMGLFANITANFLPKKATNSPIVSKNESLSIIAGLSYSF
jgi:outer membrane protein